MIDYKPFIDAISHPNKKRVAIAIIAEEMPPEGLYDLYGRLRVMEMTKEINRYKKNPENYHLYKGSCETCGNSKKV